MSVPAFDKGEKFHTVHEFLWEMFDALKESRANGICSYRTGSESGVMIQVVIAMRQRPSMDSAANDDSKT